MNLKDAIGKEQFLFEDKQYTHGDFLEMPPEELEAFKARLNVKMKNISNIIKEKKESENYDWYKRKKYFLSLISNMLPYIKSMLKQRLKMERNLSDYFMDQAKADLPPDDFESLLAMARAKKQLEGKYGA